MSEETRRRTLILGALGVVFGDLGTSPIYTVQTLFNPDDPHPIGATTDSILGIVSLIFWTVTIIVTVTYVLLVMRADNDGEGGIMALITLIRRGGMSGTRRTQLMLAGLGLFGASLFLGDSMITPAISVLSAVEGLKVAQPSLGHLVVPITAAIILALFMLQRQGTATVGRLFGPVMLVWFVTIAACGISGIADHPSILRAFSPTYALDFFFSHFSTAFFALAGVVLAVTGAEALYADMGHFGRGPIRRGWLLVVFPACILSYMGQGALILDNRTNISSPFFLLAPGWGQWPLVFIATAATVIASQAVITGAFSVARQAVQLGYLPRLRIAHTSEESIGQVYVPWINWLLLVSVLTLVFTFESSSALAFAYGMAVTGTIAITTLLFFYVVRHRWGKPLWLVALAAVPLLIFDLLILAANLTKFTHGAWLPLLIAVIVFTVLSTWYRGREIVTRRREQEEGPLRAFVDGLHDHKPPVERVPGTAVFLNRTKLTAPLAMRACVDHLHALNEQVVILSIDTKPVPHVAPADRLVIDELGYTDDGILHATARFGYMDRPAVPPVIRQIAQTPTECRVDAENASYFLSTIDLKRGDSDELTRWRKTLFLATARITADAAEYFGLPRERTVIMGSRIEV
ncbi:MAG TPA: potassium transporter Kup [Solirubrobacteraceae bacterium]|nr:potassium transporter Kup [Solirubrobacteraceae bacterium]